MTTSATLIVTTNLPDAASAQKLAALLIEQRLAACVNILAPCLSIYRWNGKIEETTEVPLLIKTSAACYDALEACIRAHHPYELPEILAVPVVCGLAEYTNWIETETASDTSENASTAYKTSC